MLQNQENDAAGVASRRLNTRHGGGKARMAIGPADLLLSGGVVAGALALTLATTSDVKWGWYIPALALAATFGFLDTARFIRGRGDFLDPAVLLGLVWIPLFVVSPIKQLAWDYWPYVPSLAGSMDWIDLWALLNLVGILLYQVALRGAFSGRPSRSFRLITTWVITDRIKFALILMFLLMVGVTSQIFVYAKFGGVSGFIEAFGDRQESGVGEFDPFAGMGVPMILADGFKLTIAIAIIWWARNKAFARAWWFLGAMMALLLVTALLFGGLKGSRSATLLALFFAAGLYHLQVKPITRTQLALALLFAFVFASGYYWYKVADIFAADSLAETV